MSGGPSRIHLAYFCAAILATIQPTTMENIQNAGGKGYCILYIFMFLFFFFSWGVMLCNQGQLQNFAK